VQQQMSNTSPFNTNKNNNVVYIQGGDKKVMKKILSVALSTAMAFSMFASVAFGDTLTTQDKFDSLVKKGVFIGYPDGSAKLQNEMTRAEFAKVISKVVGLKETLPSVLSYKDKNYNAKHWAAPYIEAVTAAGIMQGQDLTKQLFNPTAHVTVQELAIVLVNAMDLEVPATTDNTATEWAKKEVQAAINAGLLDKGLNFQSNASRSLLVEAAFAAEAALSVPVVTEATKVESASANNYKEVTVAFDGSVDKASATNPNNYTITGLSFDGATLSADAKSVKLRIAQTAGKLDRQKEYTLNVKGVKASNLSKTISQEVKFTPVDVTLPEVQEVVGLGTKAFKVVFSEPVLQSSVVSTANFKVDGKAVSGYVKYSYPNVAIVSTTLAIGAHTLSVSNVEDYAGFKVASVTKDFTVAEDKEAPEITTVVTDDLSRVELTFNESVKSISKIYQTSSSRTATYVIEDNKVIATFTGDNKLSLAETTIYVEGVTDYSDNSANRSAKVTPVLDVIRPEVVGVTAEVYKNSQEFTVEFTEAVNVTDAKATANYTLKDKDGKVVKIKGFNQDGHPVTTPTIVSTSQGKQVKFQTLGLLDTGVYTVEVANVRDQSALGNVMIPYSTTINLGDVAKPTILGTSYYEVTRPGNDSSITGLDITVNFSKAISLDGSGTALDANKYNYSVGTTASASTYLPLPTNATVTAINADTIRISLPAKDGGYLVSPAVLNLRAVNIADTNGNYIAGNLATAPLNVKSDKKVTLLTAKATNEDTIVAEFSGNLAYVDNNDFAVTVGAATYAVKEASIDGAKVTFKLDGKKFAPNVGIVTLGVKSGIEVQSVNSNGLKADGTKTITDSISPSYVDNKIVVAAGTVNTHTATLTFDEALKVFENPTAFSVKVDGESATVKTVTGSSNQVVVTFEYTGTLTGKALEVYLNSDNTSSKFITDTLGNAANIFSEYIEKL
jgi:hypothetical protein